MLNGKRTVNDIHRELGSILWEYCGMARSEKGLLKAKRLIPELKQEFWENAIVPGSDKDLNQSLERAGRVADFLDFAQLLVEDALCRKESCGCHFNVAYQTEDHEALRQDDTSCYVSAWEYTGDDTSPVMHKEYLKFENVNLTRRSYK